MQPGGCDPWRFICTPEYLQHCAMALVWLPWLDRSAWRGEFLSQVSTHLRMELSFFNAWFKLWPNVRHLAIAYLLSSDHTFWAWYVHFLLWSKACLLDCWRQHYWCANAGGFRKERRRNSFRIVQALCHRQLICKETLNDFKYPIILQKKSWRKMTWNRKSIGQYLSILAENPSDRP